MSQSRYTDRKGITGQYTGKIMRLLAVMFKNEDDLSHFVEEKLGREISNSVAWNGTLNHSAFDLIETLRCQGGVGRLLAALEEKQADNQELKAITTYLVEAGYLSDNQATGPAAPTNPRVDWITQYGFDRAQLSGDSRQVIVKEVAPLFPSTASVERFLTENFDSDFGRQVAHSIQSGWTVEQTLSHVYGRFNEVRWLTALVAALYAKTQHWLLQVTLYQMTHPEKFTTTSPAPQAAPVPTPAPAAAPAPQALTVKSVVQTNLAKELHEELCQLLLKAFNSDSLSQLCFYKLGEPFQNIVGPGPFGKQCRDLIDWCLSEQNQLANLLNAMMKERPHRTDIAPYVRKLAAAGYITIDG